MKRYILKRIVARLERFLGVDLPHLEEIVEQAPGAMVPIGLFMPASSYGRTVPSDVLHMVRIGATQAQECGECLQIAVNVARKEGVPPELLQAAVRGRFAELRPDLADAVEFGERVGSGLDASAEREALRARFGPRGVIEVSMAAATAHLFPALKRGMGFAQACRVDALDLGVTAPAETPAGEPVHA